MAPILEINSTKGDTMCTQLEINSVFREYYEQLYKTPHKLTIMDYAPFFDDIQLPQLLEGYKEEVKKPVTGMEIRVAIKALPRNKAPGGDGLPI